MKRILLSLSIIGIVSAIVIGATVAYFGDVETSPGNTFTAGSIDLKIDLQCPDDLCHLSLGDLHGEVFFNECDIKPGDEGEVTISWHIYNNDAWARIRMADLYDKENLCTEPEVESGDNTCEELGGELSQYLTFTFWMDEGQNPGWQCPDNKPCNDDPLEGDNILNGIEEIFATSTAKEMVDNPVVLPIELKGSTTYYLGMKWEIPEDAGNIIQTDSLVGKIIMEAVQSRNNPTKEF